MQARAYLKVYISRAMYGWFIAVRALEWTQMDSWKFSNASIWLEIQIFCVCCQIKMGLFHKKTHKRQKRPYPKPKFLEESKQPSVACLRSGPRERHMEVYTGTVIIFLSCVSTRLSIVFI